MKKAIHQKKATENQVEIFKKRQEAEKQKHIPKKIKKIKEGHFR